MSDRTMLLEDFALAAGRLTESALNELTPEKRAALDKPLSSGVAHIRLNVVLSPLIVVGSLHHTLDRTVPSQVLFRIDGDGLPNEGDFN